MKKKTLIIIIAAVIVVGCLVTTILVCNNLIFNKNLNSALISVCDRLNDRSGAISFTNAEYRALSKASGRSIENVQDAMTTQVVRVAIAEKIRVIIDNEQYDEFLKVISYLSENEFYFYMDSNDFDIIFTEEELDKVTEFILNNNSGSVTTGYTTSYIYNERVMVFDYNKKFSGIKSESLIIMVSAEAEWRKSTFRSSYALYVGDQFSVENLVYSPPKNISSKPSFSDYLKENAPDLYDTIVDRYESLK